MKNPYSFTLVMILGLSIIITGFLALNGQGVPALIGGTIIGIIAFNAKILEDSPRTVGVISFLGKRTKHSEEGLVFLLGPIINVIEFPIALKEKPYTLKSVQCRVGAVDGKFEVGIKPLTDGASLGQFDDVGRYNGAFALIDDPIRAALQEIISTLSVDEVVKNQHNLQVQVLAKACGKIRGDTDATNDLRGLGFSIEKFNLNLVKDDKTLEAEKKSLSADALAKRVIARIDQIKELNRGRDPQNQEPVPTFEKAREQLLQEDKIDQRLVQEYEIKGAPRGNFILDGNGNRQNH